MQRVSMPLPAEVSELLIPLDPQSDTPLHRQIYHGLREAILSGRLPSGLRIPSTRLLAGSLGVSRSTILVAFEQLVADGFIVGSVGSGSYVATELPARLLANRAAVPSPPGGKVRVADRVRQLESLTPTGWRIPHPPAPFRAGTPPLDQFPAAQWSRFLARRARTLSSAELQYGKPLGYLPLREAIVAHHAAVRGVRCTPEQVIVLASAQEALELSCRVLLDPGDPAWLEEPFYHGARGAYLLAGARAVPVPVDDEGLAVDMGIALAPEARLATVTPSHQYPLGVTMSLPRRLALLEWARDTGAWILEDDYDSEYRYGSQPLTALQGLDGSGRVLYIGTFSKTLFPSLRLAYLVVPEPLIDSFLRVRRVGAQHAPTLDQAVLRDFIVDGQYARHIRRMRTLCRERRDALVEAAKRDAADVLELMVPETGLHTIAWLRDGVDDRVAHAAVTARGVDVAPLSNYYMGDCPRPGLILGFAGYPVDALGASLRIMAEALRQL
ncbi:MAG TPA: PLP-dependent aminotransferase family protein [Gemmatimonadales bacterium]|nr:PLP-dependent aminotransferase family protein [Gemmatimonadales bacterium]